MPDERPYLDPYLRAAEDFGPGFEALLWRSPAAQRARFRTIARMARLTGRVVADVGCGNADLLLDLHRRGRPPARYLGIDAVPATLDFARRQARDAGAEAEFIESDFVRDEALPERLVSAGADAVVFCGSLNTLGQAEAQAVLDRFWRPLTARPGAAMVFNFLSLRHNRARTPASPPAVRFEPVDMLAWAIERTPLVTFRHDYLNGHDATVCMRTPAA